MTTLQIVCDMNESESKEPKKEENKEEQHKEIIIEKEDIKIEESKKEKQKVEEHKENEIKIVDIKKEKIRIEKEDLIEIYFIIVYSRDQKESPNDMIFSEECKIIPEVILSEEIKTSNDKYTYKKVLKINNNEHKKNADISFFLDKDDYKYYISFEIKDKTFIYDVSLEKRVKYLSNIKKINIIENSIKYEDKFNLFIEALEKRKEGNKMKKLYLETIELYSKKSSFSFLIYLFSKVYEEKNSCELLLKKFYEMNINIQKNKNDSKNNSDRKPNLGQKFNSLIIKISEKSDNLIKSNGYNPIHFNGILFCYLNYYDYNIFENNINKLYIENSDILYETLLVYHSNLINPLKEEEIDKNFFVNFFKYIISKKDFSYFNIGLKFISNLYTFISVIDKTKDQIYNKYIKNEDNKTYFKYIEFEDNLKLKSDKIDDIIERIKSINEYSEKIKKLLVYFKSVFWKKKLLEEFGKPLPKFFEICLNLRDVFFKYNKIVQSVCDRERDKDIIEDIINFGNNDEFAVVLNHNIKKFFRIKKGKINNSEILGYIQEYNPYYREKEYKNKREPYILDNLVFEYDICNQDDELIELHNNFIQTFRLLEYEDIFKENMAKFIDLMVNKITDISSFDTVIDLIAVDKIKEKVDYYIEKLKNKYEKTVKTELKKLTDIKQKKSAEIIAKFEKLIFEQENNCNFLRNSISKLEMCPLIYIQLIIKCKDNKYRKMKEFIYQEFLNNINIIDSIISLIDSLESNDKNNFLKELMKKCRFTSDEFYSKKDNNKINLLYELYKNKKIQKISADIKSTLENIFKDIDEQEIDKNKLEEFFKNPEEVIKKRLELVKLYFDKFEPENLYEQLKRSLENINKDIEVLSKIKTSLSIFQRERYQEEIRQMVELIHELYSIKLKNYESYYELIDKLKALELIAKQTESVQDFLLFRVIYDNAKGNNQEVRFNNAIETLEKIKDLLTNEKSDINELYKQNKETFDIIKRKLINNKERSDKFFNTFKIYFNLGETKEKKEVMDDLTLIFNSKKYELDLKSIIYFFNNFDSNNEWSQNLFKEYENLSELDLNNLKIKLKELKQLEIYDYQTESNYRLFN